MSENMMSLMLSLNQSFIQLNILLKAFILVEMVLSTFPTVAEDIGLAIHFSSFLTLYQNLFG